MSKIEDFIQNSTPFESIADETLSEIEEGLWQEAIKERDTHLDLTLVAGNSEQALSIFPLLALAVCAAIVVLFSMQHTDSNVEPSTQHEQDQITGIEETTTSHFSGEEEELSEYSGLPLQDRVRKETTTTIRDDYNHAGIFEYQWNEAKTGCIAVFHEGDDPSHVEDEQSSPEDPMNGVYKLFEQDAGGGFRLKEEVTQFTMVWGGTQSSSVKFKYLYRYNANGSLLEKLLYNEEENGSGSSEWLESTGIFYSYDKADRLLERKTESYAQGVASVVEEARYEYKEINAGELNRKLISASGDLLTETLTKRDELGRIVYEKEETFLQGLVCSRTIVKNEYDPWGRKTKVVESNESESKFEARMAGSNLPPEIDMDTIGNHVSLYVYDTHGRLKRITKTTSRTRGTSSECVIEVITKYFYK